MQVLGTRGFPLSFLYSVESVSTPQALGKWAPCMECVQQYSCFCLVAYLVEIDRLTDLRPILTMLRCFGKYHGKLLVNCCPGAEYSSRYGAGALLTSHQAAVEYKV